MKIYNISQANYQSQNNNKPSFGAKVKLDLDTKLIHDLEKLDLDYGIIGFFTGRPLQTAMSKLKAIHPEHIVEFSYQKPVNYGFNYVKGQGVATSEAKIIVKNIVTGKAETKVLDHSSEHPFLDLINSVIKNTNFWSK